MRKNGKSPLENQLFRKEVANLIGEFQHNMDQKGRITIPAKFRDELGEKFYVCKGTEKCLFVYSEEKMQQTIERIEALPAAQSNVLRRYFLAGASEADPDKQGRILIPQNLRDHADLSKECVVIGTGSRAEIWDAAEWLSFSTADVDMTEILKNISL